MDVLVMGDTRRRNDPCRRGSHGLVGAVGALALSLVPLAAAPALGDGTPGPARLSPQGVPLVHAVPSDVGLYLHVRMPGSEGGAVPPAPAAGHRGIDALFKALAAPSFMQRFASHLDDIVVARKRRLLDAELAYWRGLLEKGAWWKLFRNEFFLAGRLEIKELDRRAWLAGFRVDSSEERVLFLSRLRELLAAFSAIVPASELDVGERDGANVTCLYSLLEPTLVEVCAAGREDIVLLSTSRRLLRHSLQLLEGESSDVPFAMSRASEMRAAAQPDEPLAWLSDRSTFFSAEVGRSLPAEKPLAGFELTVKPSELFGELARDDPLLGDWKSFTAAGEFETGDYRGAGIRCVFDTDLDAGQDELERVIYRTVVQPIEDLDVAPILYREVGALLPRDPEELESPEVTVLLRELVRWLRDGLRVFEGDVRRVESETVSVRSGGRRLRGEVRFPLALRLLEPK